MTHSLRLLSFIAVFALPAIGFGQGQTWGTAAGDPAAQIPALHASQPSAGEQPVAVLQGAGAIAQNPAWLTEGHKAMLRKYPGFKMPVYPSHRTAKLPANIYANSAANASTSRIQPNGLGVTGFKPGIAFPNAKNGTEVLWNHLLRWRGPNVKRTVNQLVVNARGDTVQDSVLEDQVQWTFNQKGNGELARFLQLVKKPVGLAGGNLLIVEPMDHGQARQVWRYNTALRKVVRAPGVEFDFPGTASDNQRTSDNFDIFAGSPEQYNWRLLSPQPVPKIVPYNALPLKAYGDANNYKAAVSGGHLKSEALRYEVHRVWVVEGTLKSGKNNSQKKRVFYVDEDSFGIVSADIYDANGLWRVQEAHNYQHSVGTYWEGGMTVQDLKNNKMLLFGVVGRPDFNQPARAPFNQRDLLKNR